MYRFCALAILVVLSMALFSSAYAHQTLKVENLEIEVGWQEEPPLVGFKNAITFEIKENTADGQSGVKNSFKNLQATVKYGGLSKQLDIESEIEAGHYHAQIIPTKTGTYTIDLKGDINGIAINSVAKIEDVEDKSLLAFPDAGDDNAGSIVPLKNAVSDLQKDVEMLKKEPVQNTLIENAYNFGIFGLSLGAAGVILAIIAMIKRK